MSSPLTIIDSAWQFYCKQPVLNQIAFWLFFAPVATIDAVVGGVGNAYAQGTTMKVEDMSPEMIALAVPVVIALVYLMLWGQACTLLVGKRMITSPAGRTRTSFAAVRKQARKFIFPLFITEIIRTGIALLWMLLLIVPGIIYLIRTTFYSIMMVAENGPYGRPALRKSVDVVKGRTWEVTWKLMVISVMIFLPVVVTGFIVVHALTAADERLLTLGIVLTDALEAFAGMFFTTTIVALYADLKSSSSPST